MRFPVLLGATQVEMSDDDRGLTLRLAFDDAIRKVLPALDLEFRVRSTTVGG